jgi:hypothetical protein
LYDNNIKDDKNNYSKKLINKVTNSLHKENSNNIDDFLYQELNFKGYNRTFNKFNINNKEEEIINSNNDNQRQKSYKQKDNNININNNDFNKENNISNINNNTNFNDNKYMQTEIINKNNDNNNISNLIMNNDKDYIYFNKSKIIMNNQKKTQIIIV